MSRLIRRPYDAPAMACLSGPGFKDASEASGVAGHHEKLAGSPIRRRLRVA